MTASQQGSAGMAWGNGWIGPFEGPFTLVQKFAWANLPGFAETRAMFGERNTNVHFAKHLHPAVSLLCAREGIQFPLSTRSFLEVVAGDWLGVLVAGRTLRYCPECMRHGYHSPIYQVDLIERCPLHDCMLNDMCPHCGKPTPYFELTPKLLKNPMGCIWCGTHWVDAGSALWSETQDFHAQVGIALAPLYGWIESLSRIDNLDRLFYPLGPMVRIFSNSDFLSVLPQMEDYEASLSIATLPHDDADFSAARKAIQRYVRHAELLSAASDPLLSIVRGQSLLLQCMYRQHKCETGWDVTALCDRGFHLTCAGFRVDVSSYMQRTRLPSAT